MRRFPPLLHAAFGLSLVACADRPLDPGSETESESGSESDSDSETESGPAPVYDGSWAIGAYSWEQDVGGYWPNAHVYQLELRADGVAHWTYAACDAQDEVQTEDGFALWRASGEGVVSILPDPEIENQSGFDYDVETFYFPLFGSATRWDIRLGVDEHEGEGIELDVYSPFSDGEPSRGFLAEGGRCVRCHAEGSSESYSCDP